MNEQFGTAMARATAATRNRDLGEATRIIGEALGLRAVAEAEAPRTAAGGVPRAAAARPRIDPQAEVVEPVAEDGADAPLETITESAGGPFARRRTGRGLGEVVRLLGEGKRAFAGLTGDLPGLSGLSGGMLGGLGAAREPELVEGARFETRRFACPAGAREYRLYVPAALAAGEAKARGVVVMLHGCKQGPEDFATGTGMNAQGEAEGLVVVYPRQTSADNASGCWNWFRPGDQRRDAGEPAILAGMAREVAAEFGVEPGAVFVAGLSAGGAMAAVLAESYPDVFAAAGIHSGLPTGAARDVMGAFAAMRGDAAAGSPGATPGRRIVFQGTGDRTVDARNAARLLPEAEGAPEVPGEAPGGRRFTRALVAGADGLAKGEMWMIAGAGHAWMGGNAAGSYTDPTGPDASAEMVRFFLGREGA